MLPNEVIIHQHNPPSEIRILNNAEKPFTKKKLTNTIIIIVISVIILVGVAIGISFAINKKDNDNDNNNDNNNGNNNDNEIDNGSDIKENQPVPFTKKK